MEANSAPFDPRAVLRHLQPKPEAVTLDMEMAEEAMPHGKSEEEKYEHHRKMAKSAPGKAARAMHQKLMAHHKSKMAL